MQLPIKMPFELMLTKWASILNPVIANPLNGVLILKNVALVSGNNQIPHLLQQIQQVWIITDIQGVADIYRYQAFDAVYLYLNASTGVTVSIGVLMSDVINSPNMNLPVPIVGQDPGPDWANNYNSCLSVVDGHNHSSGSGVQITQSGINLIAAATTFDSLGFNTSNATDLRSVRFTPQGSPLALGTDVGSSL